MIVGLFSDTPGANFLRGRDSSTKFGWQWQQLVLTPASTRGTVLEWGLLPMLHGAACKIH